MTKHFIGLYIRSMPKTHQAILLKICSFMFFSWNNAISKTLSTSGEATSNLSVSNILFYQYTICLIAMSVYKRKDFFRSLSRLQKTHLHVLRGVLCLLGLTFLHQSFKGLSLFQATGFNLLSPALSVALGVLIFKESFGFHKQAALTCNVIAYFFLLIPQTFSYPDQPGASTWLLLMPTLSVLCFQLNTFATKKLTQVNESAFHLLISTFVLIPLFLLPSAMAQPVLPSVWQMAMLCVMSGNLMIALLCLNKAIAIAEISFLVPLAFAKQLLNAVFGVMYFQEIPSVMHIAGIAMGLLGIYMLSKSPTDPNNRGSNEDMLPENPRAQTTPSF